MIHPSNRLAPIRLRTLLLPALALPMILALACGRPSKPVAKVNDTWIGQDRWIAFLKASKIDPKVPIPEKEKALKGLLRRSVAVELAKKRGLDKKGWTPEQREAYAEQIATSTLLQDRLDKLPPIGDKESRDYFFGKFEQRHLRHILCATDAEAKAVVEQLKAGKAFKDLVAKHSLDKASSAKEGDLGWRRRQDVPPKFADQIFQAADGALLGPFQTDGGWEIVLVAERRVPEEATYALQKPEVLKQIQRDRAARMREDLIQESQKAYALKIRQDALPAVLAPQILPADSKTIVAEVGPVPITMRELKEFVTAMAERSGGRTQVQKADLSKYLTMMSSEKSVFAMARAQGIPGRKDVHARIWNLEQDAMANLFGQAYLEEVPVTEQVLKTFYETNKATFLSPNEVMVKYLEADTQKQLVDAVTAIRGGATWGAAQQKFGVRPMNGGEPQAFDFKNPPNTVPPETVRALTTAPQGVWLGTFPAPRGLMALQVVSSKPGKQLTFEEAGGKVRETYLHRNGYKVLEAYLDGEGRKGIRVETFPKNL